jgi:hypothetical protein
VVAAKVPPPIRVLVLLPERQAALDVVAVVDEQSPQDVGKDWVARVDGGGADVVGTCTFGGVYCLCKPSLESGDGKHV